MHSVAVVEDDERILDAVQLVLECEGWDVLAYGTGEAFLAEFQHHPLDCVILDPHLPGISGADVAGAIATETNTPIICLTARPGSSVTLAVERHGVIVTLTKPVTAEDLVAHVQGALNGAASRG